MDDNTRISELLEAILEQLTNQSNASYTGSKSNDYLTNEYLRGGYGKTYSDIKKMRDSHKIYKEDKKLLKEFQEELRNTGQASDELKERLKELGHNVDELTNSEEALEKAISAASEGSSKTGFANRLIAANGITERIKGNLKSIDQRLYGLAKPWAEANAAASKYAKTIGLTEAGLDSLQKYSQKNVAKGYIGIDFNVSTQELIEMQQNYSNAIGRNIMAGDMGNQKAIAAMHAVMQGREMELAVAFENFGLNLERTGDHAGKMFADAAKSGISFEKYSSNVAKNIRIAQNYTFKNGLKGLESMAKKATALKIDMGQVAALADKVSSVEGAIDVASKLQVLGGPFASFADPLGMMSEGLLDMESLTDRITNMIGGLGNFNKKTGEVEVSAFNKQRIKAAADAMGMSYDNLMESVNAQTKRKIIEGQINSSVNARGLSEDMKELLKNSASFNKEGKAGVSINGEFKTLDQLKDKDYEELVKETQSESEDIKDIAKHVRSLDEKRSGLGKQFDANQARLFGWVGKAMGWTADFVGQHNWMLQIGVIAAGIGTLIGIVGNMANIWSSFGRIGGGGGGTRVVGRLGNLFKPKTAPTASGKTAPTASGKSSPKAVGKTKVGNSNKSGKAKGKVKGKGKGKGGGKIKPKKINNKTVAEIEKNSAKKGAKGATEKVAGKKIAEQTASNTVEKTAEKAAASKAAEKTAEKAAVSKAAEKTAEQTAKKAGIKFLEKDATGALRLTTGAAKAVNVAGWVGVAGNLATDYAIDKGYMDTGTTGHYAAKTGFSAAEGAAMGAAIGSIVPGIGNAIGAGVGAAIGSAIGFVDADKYRKQENINNKLSLQGKQLKGDYGVFMTEAIQEAMQTGELNSFWRKRVKKLLIEGGDEDLLEILDRKTIADSKRNKEFGEKIIKMSGIDLQGMSTDDIIKGGYKKLLPKPETGLNQDAVSLNERAKKKEEKLLAENELRKKQYEEFLTKPLGGKFEMNLNGTIKLAGSNGKSIDISKELLGDENFKKELAMKIKDQINYSLDGGNFPQRGMSV